jgi:hypothetical protein
MKKQPAAMAAIAQSVTKTPGEAKFWGRSQEMSRAEVRSCGC